MGRREKLISLYKEAGFVVAAAVAGKKALGKALRPFDRFFVNHGLYLQRYTGFREDWIDINFGILGGDALDKKSVLFSEYERLQLISAAEDVCKRTFTLLGTGPIHFEGAMPWHTDIGSNHTWPMVYYADIEADIGSQAYFNRGCDIKMPWEFSRLQFLVSLGQAYWLTGEHRFYEEFAVLFRDWAARNPLKIGCNWACPMDVAMRGASICAATAFFKEALKDDPGLSRVIFEQLINTGRFVARHLEEDLLGHGNNHLLANLAGLLFIGIMIRKTNPEGSRWLQTAMTGLEREIRWQVNSDGGSFEGSLSYHRLASEMLLMCAIVAQQNGFSFSKDYLNRLEMMCQFAQAYIKPNGMAPVVGDADDGRFMVLDGFGKAEHRDHRHLLGAAGVFFNRSDFYSTAESGRLDGKWLFGNRQPAGMTASCPSTLAVYSETGIVRYLKDGVYILIKCGPLGLKGIGTHDHNDQLSFELNIDGRDIIIDSGSFAYTGNRKLRQQYRSASAHNLTVYEEWEQNIIKDDSLEDLFCMHSRNSGQILKVEETGTGFIFCGSIKQGESEVMLVRKMILDTSRRILEIKDTLDGADQDARSRTRLHLSPGVNIMRIKGNSAHLKAGDKVICIEASNALSAEPACISPSYGVAHQSSVLQWSGGNSSNAVISY